MLGVTHVHAVEASKNKRQQKVQNAHPVTTGSVDARALSAHNTGDHAGASLWAPPVLHTHTVVGHSTGDHAGARVPLVPHTHTVVSQLQAAREPVKKTRVVRHKVREGELSDTPRQGKEGPHKPTRKYKSTDTSAC